MRLPASCLMPVSGEPFLTAHIWSPTLWVPADTITSLGPGVDRLHRRGQRDLAERDAAGQGVADRGAAAGRGQDAGDVDAVVLEEAFLHGDGVGRAVELAAPMGDGDGFRAGGEAGQGEAGRQQRA